MNRLLLLLPLLLAPVQEPGGIILDRTVHLWMRDPVDRVREFKQSERVKIQGDRLAIDDLTFGTRLIIRRDTKTVWVADLTAGTYSELTFEQVARRRADVIAEIQGAKVRVAGSTEEGPIEDVLKGLGVYPVPPTVEILETPKQELVAGRASTGRELVIDKDIHYIDVVVDPTLADALSYFDFLAAIGAYPAEVAGALKRLGGFPMKGTVRYCLFLDRVKSEEEVSSVRRASIPDADFTLPAGLKKVPLAGFEAGAGPAPEKPKNMSRSFKEDEIDRENNPLRTDPKDDSKPKPK